MKNSYILLRNNKESGPHNLSDLQNLGLRSADLVWVEGQSVCWLHPGEIAELKSLPTTGNGTKLPVTVPVQEEETVSVQEEETVSVQEEELEPVTDTEKSVTEIPVKKKSIFISMPVNSTAIENKYAPPAAPVYLPDRFTSVDEPVNTTTKFAQPLDEIKEMYVKKLQERKQKTVSKKNLVKYIRAAAVITGLLGIGLFAGILLQKGNNKKSALAGDKEKQPAQQQVTTALPAEPSEPVLPENPPAENTGIPGDEITQVPADAKLEKQLSNRKNKKTSPVANDESPETNASGPDLTVTNGERNSKTRNEATETQTVSIESISPLVSVKSNDYKVAAFGGVKDLQLTVTNDSKYILDNVQVEIQYLKPSDETVKTETLYFKTVPPNGSQTIAVPRSSRGVKVNYKITRIESKQIGGVAGLKP